MSGVGAVYSWDRYPCEVDIVKQMAHNLSHRGNATGWWVDGSVGLAASEWRDVVSGEQEKQPTLPYYWSAGNCWVAEDARLDNRADLLVQLHARSIEIQTGTEAEYIAAAYTLWGTNCGQHLLGDFAFVLWDSNRQHLFAACSPSGLRPLVYHIQGHRLLCASEPRQLFTDVSVSRELNDSWISFWLCQSEDHWETTIYRSIQRLIPGHWLIANAQGVKISSFWKPIQHTGILYTSQEDYIQHFQTLFAKAVQDRLLSNRPLYFDLSGGLDSSSIVAMAARIGEQAGKKEQLHCFHAYDDTSTSSDPRQYVRAMTEMYREVTVHTVPFREHLYLDGAFDPAPWMDVPCKPTLILASFYRQQWSIASQLQARVHLRGDFGDELLAATPGYLTDCWNEHRYFTLARELRRWKQWCGLSSMSLLEQWVVSPTLLRREKNNPIREVSRQVTWLRPDVNLRAEARLREDEAYFRKVCPNPFARELFRWMRFHCKYTTQADVALRVAGLETREPFADMRLIEFLLATPPQLQIRPFPRKYLLREAMRGILPEVIRTRTDKGQAYRLYFRGVAKHRLQLRELVIHMPEMLAPYIDKAALLTTIDRIALGDQVNVPAFSGTIALLLWSHRLPWAGGKLYASSS